MLDTPRTRWRRRLPDGLRRLGYALAHPGTFSLRQGARTFILASLVGLAAGLAAVGFKYLLDLVTAFSWGHLIGMNPHGASGEPKAVAFEATGELMPLALVAVPAFGGLLAGWLVHRFAPEAAGPGTGHAIEAFHQNKGMIRNRVPLVKAVASAITIGTGGSGGREGPIAQIGAGIGSMIADWMHLGPRGRRILLSAGIGAGVGAIFRAPLAAAVFATEVLYRDEDLETDVLLPATIAAIVGYSVYGSWFGFGHILRGTSDLMFTGPLELIPYLVLALASVAAAGAYSSMFLGMTEAFKQLPISPWLKPSIGGVLAGLVALGLYLMVEDTTVLAVLGPGSRILEWSMDTDVERLGIRLLLIVALGKMVTTSFSIGSGGAGGTFGPAIVIGGALGGMIGKAFHAIAPALAPHPGAFVLVGMAGFFTVVANTPISTVIMVSELAGNYQLLIPAMWVASLCMLLGRRITIYPDQLPNRFHSPAHMGRQIRDMVTSSTVGDVYKKRRKVLQVPEDATLGDIVRMVGASHQRLFPVVDEAGELVGAFRIEDLTHALEEHGVRAKVEARDLIVGHGRPPTVCEDEPLDRAVGIVCSGLREEVLVVDPGDPTRVQGLLTRADILVGYNRAVAGVEQFGPDQDLDLGLEAREAAEQEEEEQGFTLDHGEHEGEE